MQWIWKHNRERERKKTMSANGNNTPITNHKWWYMSCNTCLFIYKETKCNAVAQINSSFFTLDLYKIVRICVCLLCDVEIFHFFFHRINTLCVHVLNACHFRVNEKKKISKKKTRKNKQKQISVHVKRGGGREEEIDKEKNSWQTKAYAYTTISFSQVSYFLNDVGTPKKIFSTHNKYC